VHLGHLSFATTSGGRTRQCPSDIHRCNHAEPR
jgi:hypothetical protein